jgi:hypothetical protein
MHFAGLLGESRKDFEGAGWTAVGEGGSHQWETAMGKINDYIQSLNFGYRKSLKG